MINLARQQFLARLSIILLSNSAPNRARLLSKYYYLMLKAALLKGQRQHGAQSPRMAEG